MSPEWVAEQLGAVLDMAGAAVRLSVDDEDFRLKIVAETALLVRAIVRSEGVAPGLRLRARDLGSSLAAEARSPSMLRLGALRPSAAAEFAAAHAALADAGLPDDGFGAAVARLAADPESLRVERSPWKELEQRWLRRRLPGAADLAVEAAAHAASGLVLPARGIDALAADRDELYAFTHGIIYLAGFGDDPVELPRPAADLVDDVDAALVRTLADDDFDLAAELLLTFPYVGLPWSGYARIALERLGEAADAAGVLPSLGFRADVHAAMPQEEGDAYVIRESYHTQYVWGFLLAAMLRPGRMPSSTFVDPDDRIAFARDSALWRAKRSDDVQALAAALADRSIAASAMSRQAERLLARLAIWVDGLAVAAR